MRTVARAYKSPAEPALTEGLSNNQINPLRHKISRGNAAPSLLLRALPPRRLGQKRGQRRRSPPTEKSPLPSKNRKKRTLEASWRQKENAKPLGEGDPSISTRAPPKAWIKDGLQFQLTTRPRASPKLGTDPFPSHVGLPAGAATSTPPGPQPPPPPAWGCPMHPSPPPAPEATCTVPPGTLLP